MGRGHRESGHEGQFGHSRQRFPLSVHTSDLREILSLLSDGLAESEERTMQLIGEAVRKIKEVGTDNFKKWRDEGELAGLIYEQILCRLDKAALIGQQDAVELLSDLGVKKEATCHCPGGRSSMDPCL